MILFLVVSIILLICFCLIGVGIFFFDKSADKGFCSKPTDIAEPCISLKAGLCPMGDDTGALNMMKKNRLNYYKKPT
ncbi:hypothetical protein DID75_02000 [Candidatus Marinamargulisbacteria bacterium SCGC AG-410-N11]|nr:hypothetical protein DID75_02000 [Candidatus Marinamargulisbacteria bacterium SCGC AG-410-N11]